MSGNPALSPFSGWNELHGGSMERNSSPEMGQSGEANRHSRVLQEAHRKGKDFRTGFGDGNRMLKLGRE